KAEIVAAVACRETKAPGRPAVLAGAQPGSPPGDAVAGGPQPLRVGYLTRPVRRRAVGISAPFPDISVHVEEAPGPGPAGADTGQPSQGLGRAGAGAVGLAAVEIGLIGGKRVAMSEDGDSFGAAGVLPFRLGRQAVDLVAFYLV